MTDLFGNEDTSPEPVANPTKKRHNTQPKGYAAPPGTGPKDFTCADCAHLARRKLGGTYIKCGLVAAKWTGGAGTDIKASAAACRYFQPTLGDALIYYDFSSVTSLPKKRNRPPHRDKIVARTDAMIETREHGTFHLVGGEWRDGPYKTLKVKL